MAEYSIDVIRAATRVGRIFASGCDRCDFDDLELLESAGLMTTSICRKATGDSLEKGDTMWTFNEAGQALVAAVLDQ